MASTYDQPLLPTSEKRPRAMTGGFKCEFVKRPNRDTLQTECPVCLKIMREPHQVTCCGFNYCYTCIVYIRASKRPCPNCNNKEITSFPDIGLQQKLYVSKVRCSQQREGCEWTGELGQLDEHLNTDPLPEKILEGCQLAEIACTNKCGEEMLRKDIENHQNNHCPNRPFSCEHCDYKTTYNDVTQTHWPVCGSFPLPCPNKCSATLQRQNVDSHVAKECPLTTINCDFHQVGCTVKLPRQDMVEHLTENLVTHISLLVIDHAKQQDEIVKQKAELAEHDSEIKEAKAQIAILVDENQALQCKNLSLEHGYNSLTATFKKANAELTQESCTLKEETVQLNRELTVLTKQRRAACRSIEVPPQTTIPFSSPVLALNNFSQRKKSIETWYSSPVYSHANGYKLCLGVYPNIPKKHVSVFVHLMKGELDDSLKWPFRGAVWFRVLDQQHNEEPKCHMAVFDESVDPNVCCRVVEKERAEKGWGKAMFLAHAELEPRYLQANTLLFQIYKVHVGLV